MALERIGEMGKEKCQKGKYAGAEISRFEGRRSGDCGIIGAKQREHNSSEIESRRGVISARAEISGKRRARPCICQAEAYREITAAYFVGNAVFALRESNRTSRKADMA